MKIAISIPDKIFKVAEREAKRLKVTRSELYARALESYLQAMDEASVTEALDRVYDHESSSLDRGLALLQAASLPREEW